MKHLHTILLTAATFALAVTGNAQTPPAGTPSTAAQKPKPLSSSDTRAYTAVSESLQFQMNMSTRLRGKFKDTAPDMVTFGSKLSKEVTDLYTPGVNLAQDRGVDPKNIPQGMSKTDTASVAKLSPIKDDKKWTLAFFELFAKDSKKNAQDAEKSAKTVTDPELKSYLEKAAAVIKTQSETVEAKYKELKAQK